MFVCLFVFVFVVVVVVVVVIDVVAGAASITTGCASWPDPSP